MLSWMLLMPKRTPSSGHRKPRWRVARRGSVNHASTASIWIQVQYCREHRGRLTRSMPPIMTIESREEAERSHRKGGMCSMQDTAHMRPRRGCRGLHWDLDASFPTIQAWGSLDSYACGCQLIRRMATTAPPHRVLLLRLQRGCFARAALHMAAGRWREASALSGPDFSLGGLAGPATNQIVEAAVTHHSGQEHAC